MIGWKNTKQKCFIFWIFLFFLDLPWCSIPALDGSSCGFYSDLPSQRRNSLGTCRSWNTWDSDIWNRLQWVSGPGLLQPTWTPVSGSVCRCCTWPGAGPPRPRWTWQVMLVQYIDVVVSYLWRTGSQTMDCGSCFIQLRKLSASMNPLE